MSSSMKSMSTRRDKMKQSKGFMKRQEEALEKQGRVNASSSSRVAEVMYNDDDEVVEDGVSVSGRSTYSQTPSLHPSVISSGSVYSMACSETTIGAGDNTAYWDFQHRKAVAKDLGHTCRVCKRPFNKIGQPITERRGARTSMRYHAECFSGFADPRSQATSSAHTGNLAGTQMVAAPRGKAGNKMRTSSHFSGTGAPKRGNSVVAGGNNNKISAFLGSRNDFGVKSSKGKDVIATANLEVIRENEGGLTKQQLEEHNKNMSSLQNINFTKGHK